MKKTAIADIGSNTVKMSLFRNDGTLVWEASRPVGLVGHLEKDMLTEAGIQALIDTLGRFQKKAEKEKTALHPFATASLRLAKNREEVLRRVKEATGLTVDLVSGEEEAMLSLTGVSAVSGCSLSNGILMDLGGGSCEIIATREGRIASADSLPVGALALHKKFVKNILPTKEELEAIRHYTKDLADAAGINAKAPQILAVGGSIRAAAGFHAFRFGKVKGDAPYDMTLEEMETLLCEVAAMSMDTKRALLSLCPERIHTMPAGLAALTELLSRMEGRVLTVVRGGAREGYLQKLLKQNQTRSRI